MRSTELRLGCGVLGASQRSLPDLKSPTSPSGCRGKAVGWCGTLIASVGFLVAGGCTPPGAPQGNTGNSETPTPPQLYEATLPAFAVLVSADRYSGAPATIFHLQASASANSAAVTSYAWTVDDIALGDGETIDFTTTTPGAYSIQVTATDANGQAVSDGVVLQVFDPATASQVTASSITPEAGMPGTFVRIESTALNDVAAQAQVRVGEGSPLEPYRPEPGGANFLIPLDAAAGLTTAAPVTIDLLIDGESQEQFTFTLSPSPALPADPGEVTRRWLDEGPTLIAGSETAMLGILDDLAPDLTEEERAFLQALLRLAQARFEQVQAVLEPALADLDEANRAALDQVLLANGVDLDMLSELSTSAKALRQAKNANDKILDLLCQYHDVMKAVQDFINGATQAASVLPLLALETAGSPLTPAIVGMSNIISELGIVADILNELDRLVPSIERLELGATPSTLSNENEKAVIRLYAHLKTDVDVCSDTLAKLIDELAKRSVERLAQTVPVSRLAGIVSRHSYEAIGEATRVETLNEIETFLQDTINTIATKTLSAAGLDTLLQVCRAKLCALQERSELRLQPDEEILTLAPTDGGLLLNAQDETIDFYCNINQDGPVLITAERPCGLANASGETKSLMAQTSVLCGRNTCTEDASSVLQVDITPFRTDEREALCPQFEDMIHDKWAQVTFTNTDPTETIAVAWVFVLESDLRSLPTGLCEYLVQQGNSVYPTVQDCVNTYGCGTPDGVLLAPGESLGPYPYICEQTLESTIDPSSSGGDCEEEFTLETRTRRVIAQAVYCDNIENRKANFCDVVGHYLHQFGAPYNGLPAIQLSDCP